MTGFMLVGGMTLNLQPSVGLDLLRSMAGEITYRAPTNCHTAFAGRKPQDASAIRHHRKSGALSFY